MRTLVTGGAGFIGSHLVDALLADGHEVAVLDDLSSGSRENVPASARFYEVDIRDPAAVREAFQEFQPQWVSHQAAQMSVSRSVREPHFDAEVNLIGLINVLDACVAVKTQRVAFASSGGVLYGDVATPADEQHPANPSSPYGISKWCGERYLQFYAQEHGLSCVALRYANVYGPRQNPHGEAGVVAIFCTRMFRGEGYTVNGDGKYVRDYVHVSDVVRANLAVLGAKTSGFDAFNVGTGIGTDVNQLAEMIRVACQAERRRRGDDREIPPPAHGPARAGDLRSNLVSARKLASQLNCQLTQTLQPGLEETAHWFAGHVLK